MYLPAFLPPGPRVVLVCNTLLMRPKTPIPRTKPAGQNILRNRSGQLRPASIFPALAPSSFLGTSR